MGHHVRSPRLPYRCNAGSMRPRARLSTRTRLIIGYSDDETRREVHLLTLSSFDAADGSSEIKSVPFQATGHAERRPAVWLSRIWMNLQLGVSVFRLHANLRADILETVALLEKGERRILARMH